MNFSMSVFDAFIDESVSSRPMASARMSKPRGTSIARRSSTLIRSGPYTPSRLTVSLRAASITRSITFCMSRHLMTISPICSGAIVAICDSSDGTRAAAT